MDAFWTGFWEWAKASPVLSFVLMWVAIWGMVVSVTAGKTVLVKFFGMFEYKRKVKVERQEDARPEKKTVWDRLKGEDDD